MLLKRFLRPLVLSAGAIAVISCGGSSDDSTLGTNSYPGTWSGTISTLSSSNTLINQGTMSWVIDSSGNVTGTDTITIPGITTVDAGTISSAGDLTVTTTKSGATSPTGTINASLQVIQNVLQGNGFLVVGANSTALNIQLTQTSTATLKLKIK